MPTLPPNSGWVPVWLYWFVTLGLIGLVALVSISASGAFCSMAAEQAATGAQALNCFEFWLNRYQTLVGGLIALGAAALGFYAVHRQTRAARKAEKRVQKREERAVRAVMPIAVANIIEHAARCQQAIDGLDQEDFEALTLPQFSAEAVTLIRDFLRWCRQGSDERVLSVELLSFIQIFASRYLSGTNDGALRDQCELDLCQLLIRAERLFPLMRGTNPLSQITKYEFDHAVRLMRVEQHRNRLLSSYRRVLPLGEPTAGDLVIDETEVED